MCVYVHCGCCLPTFPASLSQTVRQRCMFPVCLRVCVCMRTCPTASVHVLTNKRVGRGPAGDGSPLSGGRQPLLSPLRNAMHQRQAGRAGRPKNNQLYSRQIDTGRTGQSRREMETLPIHSKGEQTAENEGTSDRGPSGPRRLRRGRC